MPRSSLSITAMNPSLSPWECSGKQAIREARKLNHNYVGTEHLLLELLVEQDGVAAQVLMKLGVNLQRTREEVINLLGAGIPSAEPSTPPPEPPLA